MTVEHYRRRQRGHGGHHDGRSRFRRGCTCKPTAYSGSVPDGTQYALIQQAVGNVANTFANAFGTSDAYGTPLFGNTIALGSGSTAKNYVPTYPTNQFVLSSAGRTEIWSGG